ncbi:DUF4886 domain-containing protein [Clostridium thermarum]|uniref:DUF4886 domain-containing protein n=1 Tax=Clostridium thermarum TaxID=1716543 RepID=UPI0013D461BA|nr:DUF4886 domain-containing protein [Clostridium thermarum]
MGQVKILAIGNSFSEDATHYLHQIAAADGIDTKVVNLYIGGCSLEKHWQNIEQDARLYQYQRDGKATDKYVSIKEALMEEEWDFVISQQASHDSGIQETYYPYIINLYNYISECAPKAQRLLHQTWAYEIDSTHDCFVRYNHNQQEMYEKLCGAYKHAAHELGVKMIPSGDVVQKVRTKNPFRYEDGGMSLCRDGFHMHYIYGRYLLAATWYEVLFKNNILKNDYIPVTEFATGEVVDLNALRVIKECVHEVANSNNYKL